MKTLADVKIEVDRLAAMIGASGHDSVPTYGHSADFGRPHIEVDWRGYHFVVVDLGREQSRFTTINLDDVLDLVFRDVVFSLASDYELAHRIETQDCRRMMFQRQIDLLLQLDGRWAERQAEEHRRILRKHPFDDDSSVRFALSTKLRAEGHSSQTAWQMACARYPRPAG
jgi:Immunity protein 63